MSANTQPDEPFPVDDKVKVIDGKTIYKNSKWWEAVLYVETIYQEKPSRKLLWCRWMWKRITPKFGQSYEKWVEKGSIPVNFKKSWEDAKNVMNEMTDKYFLTT
jgi:hypothetical protein